MNKVILIGRLCADPEFRQTTSGIAVCRIRLAINRPKQKDQEQQADFVNCTAWRSTAEFVSRYFTKGSAITVEGSLRNKNFEDKNGVKHYGYVVMADAVGFGGDSKKEQTQGNYQPYGDAPTQNPANLPAGLNVDDFEEIISDGDNIPF